MVSPISHESASLTTGSEKAKTNGDERTPSRGAVAEEQAPLGGRVENSVTVSSAAKLLSERSQMEGEGRIHSADEAATAAQGLRALFEGNPGEALAVQAQNITPDLLDLLKAG